MSADNEIRIPAARVELAGNLDLPANAQGIVLFAHGSGSSRFSPRNRRVAEFLRQAGLATLLMDLLTAAEESVDEFTSEYRFDIGLLAARLAAATAWVRQEATTRDLAIGYFGASTGAAAALMAAAEQPPVVRAVVSRGGRPDLAGDALGRVQAPTLLVVGGLDTGVIAMNRTALAELRCEKRLEIVPGATHLFEEPGTLDEVARLSRAWFLQHLSRGGGAASGLSINWLSSFPRGAARS